MKFRQPGKQSPKNLGKVADYLKITQTQDAAQRAELIEVFLKEHLSRGMSHPAPDGNGQLPTDKQLRQDG